MQTESIQPSRAQLPTDPPARQSKGQSAVQAHWLEEGRALCLTHGPSTVVVQIECEHATANPSIWQRVVDCYSPILGELVGELSILRQELPTATKPAISSLSPVAQYMFAAAWPLRQYRLSPMAAVAGATADHVLDGIVQSGGISRAWVNNGGDIALYLAPGRSFSCGRITDLQAQQTVSADKSLCLQVSASDTSKRIGIATSGRATFGQGGRSFSLGIADAVTVMADCAARADAAATLIANAVDLPDHPGIVRNSAVQLDPDSDLRDRLVVTDVAALTSEEASIALQRGLSLAETMKEQGLIENAWLTLNDSTMTTR